MKEFEQMTYHKMSEDIVNVMMNKTQSNNPLFFRVLVAYYLAKVASTMRPTIMTMDRGAIPVNVYSINLAPSGFSKGYSTNIIENQVIKDFKTTFMRETFPIIGEASLAKIACDRARYSGDDPDEVRELVDKEFVDAGQLLFSFSEGTSPALKQMRHKILMANCGAVNFEMDEVGSNLEANSELLNTYLELYDVGKTKTKLVKNTKENVRNTEMDGGTPTNMMLFGTPDKLLDGGKIEDQFYSFLSTGYARRCLFGYIKDTQNSLDELDAATILQMRMNNSNDATLDTISKHLAILAQPQHHGKVIHVEQDVAIEIIEYERECARRVKLLAEREGIKRAELTHRYFKALKLAGAYAFVDESSIITMDHLHSAIKLVEESGKALHDLLTRDKPHVRLAKYLADVRGEVTQADLVEDLPTYKGSAGAKLEQLALATAWGRRNNVTIKRRSVNGVEMYSGESLKKTNLDELIFSVSEDIAYNYSNILGTWDDLDDFGNSTEHHWVAHHLKRGDEGAGHRADDNIIQGFNLVVIDVDGDISLNTAQVLLEGYKCMFYTTKRHQTEGKDRFRIVFPTNYIVNLDSDDYREFMNNIYAWLPFDVDDGTNDRARKWLFNDAGVIKQDGELLDVLPFIPHTSEAEELHRKQLNSSDLSKLENWFTHKAIKGDRNNQMLKYALMLVDTGHSYEGVQQAVLSLNDKLDQPMDQARVMSSIMTTVMKRIASR